MHIWEAWSNRGMYSFLFSRTLCVWAAAGNYHGVCRESCFFFASQQRENVFTREAPAVLPVRLWFTLLSSRLRYGSWATNARGNLEENLYMNWEFTGRLSSQITAFQLNFYFSVLRRANQTLWKCGIHMKNNNNNSNPAWKAPTPKRSESRAAG